jgi:hypothetical protein
MEIASHIHMTSGEFLPPVAHVTGTLRSNGGLAFPARLFLEPTTSQRHQKIEIFISDCGLDDLVQLASLLIGEELPYERWMSEIPLYLTATANVYPSDKSTKAVGTISFYGASGPVSVSITAGGLHMSWTHQGVNIGSLHVDANIGSGGVVLVEASVAPRSMPTIRIDGMCAILSPTPAPSQLELSVAGTLCLTIGSYFDVCIRDDSIYPVGAYASVSTSTEKFVEPLAQSLHDSPLVATIVSNEVPFSFTLHGVSAENCSVERRTMMLTFRGILFGRLFDVTIATCQPDNTASVIKDICSSVSAHILEQCNDAIWEIIHTFVGVSEGGLPPMPSRSSPSSRRAAVADEGTVIGEWLDRECELIDEILSDAVETV